MRPTSGLLYQEKKENSYFKPLLLWFSVTCFSTNTDLVFTSLLVISFIMKMFHFNEIFQVRNAKKKSLRIKWLGPYKYFQVANSYDRSQGGSKADQGRSQTWHTNWQCGQVLKTKGINWNPTKFTNCQKDFWPKKIQRPPEVSFGWNTQQVMGEAQDVLPGCCLQSRKTPRKAAHREEKQQDFISWLTARGS